MTVTVVKCQSYVENPIGDVYRYVGDSATSVCDLKNLPDSYPLLWYRDYPRIYVSRDNDIYFIGIPDDMKNRISVVCLRGDYDRCELTAELTISSLQITDTCT